MAEEKSRKNLTCLCLKFNISSLTVVNQVGNYKISEILKGQSHEIDQAYFEFIGRSLPIYEPLMVFKFFNFVYYFIFK